jgi:hypothetical protein
MTTRDASCGDLPVIAAVFSGSTATVASGTTAIALARIETVGCGTFSSTSGTTR